jgi:hypothetical protein
LHNIDFFKKKKKKKRIPDSPESGDMSSNQEQLFPSVTNSIRSAEVWHDDGNLVLQAKNMLFRVHRSILKRRSGVFSDMLAVPQPETSIIELVDGCPVVQLPEDDPFDIEHALRAMYNERKYVFHCLFVTDMYNLMP